MKWKFFFNGYTWWLKITTPEQLEEYISRTDSERFGASMIRIAYRNMDEAKGQTNNDNKYKDSIEQAIDLVYKNSGKDLLTSTGMFTYDAHKTYFKNLSRFGFVNINKLGGCNGCDWPELITITKDELVFPNFTRKDVVIKTWKMGERQFSGYEDKYNYHYYAYIGGIQLKDGEKTKWNTRAECEAFVDKLFAN